MRAFGYIVLLLVLPGCAHLPRIAIGKDSVVGNRDAGKPATLSRNEATTTLGIPKETTVLVTETDAVPATPTTPYVPRKLTTEWTFSQPSSFESWRADTHADTGTIDTTVAKHRIDVAERRWLLFTAIACGIAGLLVRSLLPAWPSLSNGLFLAAICAGLSWKLSDIPSWLWAAIIGCVVVLILGYKRAEWDKDNDGIPDFLQR